MKKLRMCKIASSEGFRFPLDETHVGKRGYLEYDTELPGGKITLPGDITIDSMSVWYDILEEEEDFSDEIADPMIIAKESAMRAQYTPHNGIMNPIIVLYKNNSLALLDMIEPMLNPIILRRLCEIERVENFVFAGTCAYVSKQWAQQNPMSYVLENELPPSESTKSLLYFFAQVFPDGRSTIEMYKLLDGKILWDEECSEWFERDCGHKISDEMSVLHTTWEL